MRPILRRRLIEEADLGTVASLLSSGFSSHPTAWWARGIERMRHRELPDGYPRYGRLLEIDGRIVGALLTIYARLPDAAGAEIVRCNLSSWFVQNDFAGHAPLLLGGALRDRTVTYVNVTPAPHTQPIVEAQGFRAFAEGTFACIPALAPRRERTRLHTFERAEASRWHDARLVADHAALGCICLVVEADDGPHPFVFAKPRRLQHILLATQLLYCRDISAFSRFAGVLGAALLRRNAPLTMVDGVEQLPGLRGRRINRRQKKYVFGPNTPRPGDLAYTELAIFG